MTRFIGDRDDLAGLLRDLNIRLERQERHVHNNMGPRVAGGGSIGGGDGSGNEVWIGPNPPTDPGVELWYDTDAVGPAWEAVTLINGWVAYGGPFTTLRLQRVGDRRFLSGLIRYTAGTPDPHFCSFGVGDIPAAGQDVIFPAFAGMTSGLNGACRFDVRNNGSVGVVWLPAAGGVDYLTIQGSWSVL